MTPEFEQHVILKHGPGRVLMSACALCSWFEWRGTETSRPNEVILKEHAPKDCIRCREALARAPELAAWIQGIVLKLRSDLAPKPPTFDAAKIIDVADELLRQRNYASSRESPERRAVLEALITAMGFDAREPRPRVAGHAPIATVDMSWIAGCTCGWKVPSGTTDSEDEFARHVALERTI